MTWSIEEAKQRFSEVLQAAEREPQPIFDGDRLVGVLVEPGTLQDFLEWRHRPLKPTLADYFSELRRICAEDGYTLDAPPREDRLNSAADENL